jgi:hypothetical protein
MTRDLNKKLSTIQYNSRNLPERIDFTDGKYITYVYDATGRKLRVNYRPSQTVTTGPQTDYSKNETATNSMSGRSDHDDQGDDVGFESSENFLNGEERNFT